MEKKKKKQKTKNFIPPGAGRGVGAPPYMCYICMRRSEGYGFQAVKVG